MSALILVACLCVAPDGASATCPVIAGVRSVCEASAEARSAHVDACGHAEPDRRLLIRIGGRVRERLVERRHRRRDRE